jgi:hypothetical protein
MAYNQQRRPSKMPKTITLPDELADTLQTKAEAEQISLDELVTGLLAGLLEPEPDDFSTLEEMGTKIKTTPANPANTHPAPESLADLLMNAPEGPNFDLETWTQRWAAVEAELEATSSLERVRGLLRPEGEMPTDEDLADDYTRYLIEKYT